MKISGKYFFSILILVVLYNSSYSQQKKGQSVVSVGTGLSKIGIKYADHSLLFNATCDYAFKDHFSIGPAITQQSFNYLSSGNSNAHEPNKSKTTEVNSDLLNIGIRPLYHFGKREDLDIYAGVRLGCSIQKESFAKEGNFTNDQQAKPSAQLIGGARWFLDKNFGLNFELATMSPYFASLGVYYRL